MAKKELYKATCLSDLNKLISVPMHFKSPQEAQKLMLECFRRADECRQVDEEVAYILFRRYFDFYEELNKLTTGSQLKATLFTPTFKKQCLVAMDYLEQLHESLKQRYDKLLQMRTPSPLRLPSPPRDPIEPKPAKQKPPATSKPVIEKPTNDGWINVEELAGLVKRKCNILVIDVRPEKEFTSCHLKLKQLVNIPADKLLQTGITFSQLASKMTNGPSKDLWNNRGEAEAVILIDKESGTEDSIDKPIEKVLPRTHPLRLLKDAIFKWDAQRVVTKEPRVVLGGMRQFLLRYAPLTSNPQYRVELANQSGEARISLPTLGRIDYPQLNIDEPEPVDDEVPASEPPPSASEPVDGPQEPDDVHSEPAASSETIDGEAAEEILEATTMTSLDLDERLRKLRVVKPKLTTVHPPPAQGDKVPKVDRSRKPGMKSPSFSTTALSNMVEPSTNGADPPRFVLDQSKRVSSDETIGNKVPASQTKTVTPPSSQTEESQPPGNDSSIPTTSLNGPTEPLPQFPSCHLRPSGLRNLGNTCYMNAVLQSLAHTRALATFFLRGLDNDFMNKTNPLGYGGTVSTTFQRLFTAVWSKLDCYEDLVEFKKIVGRARSTFAGSEQQDSLEFLIFLLDGLHEDMNEGTRTPNTGDDDDVDEEHLDPKERAVKAWEDYLLRNKSVIVSSFQGQLLSSIQCCVCPKRSSRFDAFMCLSLPLPSYSSCNLQECVTLFGSVERMDASYLCGRCKRKTDATKRLIVWRLPTYLIIHLKRFQYVNGEWQKRTTYVRFPVDKFEVQQGSPSYALYAVVNHFGTMESGHYTAFCRGISDGYWYEYDDSTVTRIPESRIQSSAAYILFYERLPRFDVFSRDGN